MSQLKKLRFILAILLHGWMCQSLLPGNFWNKLKSTLDPEASSVGGSHNELSVIVDCNSKIKSVDHLLENDQFNLEELPEKFADEWMGGIIYGLSENDSKHSDWYSMIKSVSQLEKDYESIDVETFAHEYTNAIMETILQLKSIHEQMEMIFGPDWDPEVQLSRHQYFKDKYSNSIWRIYEILTSDLNYPNPIHHLKVARNNSILETINFIRRYKLANHDDLENLKREFSSVNGLRWLVRAMDGVARKNTQLWNKYYFYPSDEEQIKYNFHMQHIYNTYKLLEKKQQDYVLLDLAMIDYGAEEILECWNYEPISNSFSKPMREHIQFMRKVTRYVGGELENENPNPVTKKQFFLEVKDDLLKMRKLYFDSLIPWGYKKDEFEKVFHFRYFALNFIHQRIGSDYINEPEFREYNEDTADFEARFQLYYLFHRNNEWRDILLNYAHYASKLVTKGKSQEVPANYRKGIGTVIWKRILKNVGVYEKLKTEQNNRLKRIRKDIWYREMMNKLDKRIVDLPKLKHKLEFLLSGSESEEEEKGNIWQEYIPGIIMKFLHGTLGNN